MNAKIKHLGRFFTILGLDPRPPVRAVRALPWFRQDRREFMRQHQQAQSKFGALKSFPILTERDEESGSARSHYFRQDLMVSQRIFELSPQRHIDVGSRLDGFVGSVASFREIEVLDIRPLDVELNHITFRQVDLMSPLPEEFIECTDSLSCLHTLEHFGLGRYGDPICYDGHLVGWKQLASIVKPGGTFHFSTPIGEHQRVEFNAHRIFSVPYLLEMFEPQFEVVRASYINDAGELFVDIDPRSVDASRGWGCEYGCGIFELRKRDQPVG